MAAAARVSMFGRHEDPSGRAQLRIAASGGVIVPPPPPSRKAVENGELVYTSVSQIQKFTPEAGGCPSRWYFRYVLGLPDDPPTKGQARGLEGHKRIEDYLLSGVNTLDNLERKGLRFMPEPNITPRGTQHPVPVLVEAHFGPTADGGKKKPFTQLTADGVPVVGYIDLIDPRDPRWLRLKDWKFKASLDYVAKPDELMNPRREAGIQIIGYVEALRLARARGVFGQDWVIPSHVTFQTRGALEVIETTTENGNGTVMPIQLDSAQGLWNIVSRAAIPGMRRAAKAKSHTDVPKNQQVCHKYRRACPYIATCLDRMARIRAGFSSKAPAPAVQTQETLMGLLGVMTGSRPAAPVAPPPAPPAPPVPIQVQSTPPAPVRPAPASHVLTAAHAQPGQDYEVKGVSARYLTTAKHGEATYAQFTPTAGGPPVLVDLGEQIKALAMPQVLPPDAPKSSPPAPVLEGVLVSDCKEGEKYDVNGQIGTYSGGAREFGFFDTTAGAVRLKLTDRVKPLKAAAPDTAQGPAALASDAGNPTQSAEAPKGEGSPSGVEVVGPVVPNDSTKPKKRRLKVEDKTMTPDPAPAVVGARGGSLPTGGFAATPHMIAVNQYTPPTHSADGSTEYGSMEGVWLYFGCSPLGVVTQTLGPYVDALERELLQKGQLGVHDVRVAQDSTFGFNKWKGYLAEMAREKPPPPGFYIVTSYADERVSVVAETLAQRAAPGRVTRGGG